MSTNILDFSPATLMFDCLRPESASAATSGIADLNELISRARAFVVASKADSTRRALRSDWSDFDAWCLVHGLSSLPATPQTVALYLTDRASTHAPQTLTRRLTSITQAHRAAGFTGTSPASTKQPLVGAVLKGIRRAKGVQQRGKDPLLVDKMRQLIGTCGDDLNGVRDRALLLIGFAGGFRRSELAAIEVSDLEVSPSGLVIQVRRSKTDQEGVGRRVGIPFGADFDTCPVRALKRWLAESAIVAGPVFRGVRQNGSVRKSALNPDSVAWVIKRAARRAGLDEQVFAGHSLRSGHVTQASLNKVSERAIMRQTGHRSSKSLDRYVKVLGLFDDNAAAGLGL
jgi:integrase